MIKFFRKIRQKLLSENKFSKYVLYAVGEIILVMIGILLALQVNTWNEQRKQNDLEQDYLIALKREFENNLNEVNRVIELNAELIKNAKELTTFTGPRIPNISEKKFGELFFRTVNAEVQYSPGSGVTNEIISSGKLNIFQNQELKNALATLDGLLLKIRFQENKELTPNRYDLLSIANEGASVRKMVHDAYGARFDLNEGRFLESNLHLLTLKKFDNKLIGFVYTSSFLQERYAELKKQLQEIVNIIDSQIK